MSPIGNWKALLLALAFLAAPAPAHAVDGEHYFPAETGVVVTVNVRQILRSSLLQSELQRIRRELNRNVQVRETLDSLGFDPLKDLDRVSLAGAGLADTEKALLVLTGRFDGGKFQAKAQDLAKAKGSLLRIHIEHGQPLYETNLPGQSRALFVALLDPQTVVAAFNKAYVVGALEIKAGTKKPVLSEEMGQLLAKLPPGQSIAVAGLGAALLKGFPEPDRIRNVTGGVTIGEDIRTDLTIRAKDAAAATELARLVREALDQGKNFLTLIAMSQAELAPLVGVIDTLKVAEQDSDVTLRGVVTRKYLDELKGKR
jgi:hypothetical protein